MRVPLEKGGDGLACRVDRFAETRGWGGWHRRPENPSALRAPGRVPALGNKIPPLRGAPGFSAALTDWVA